MPTLGVKLVLLIFVFAEFFFLFFQILNYFSRKQDLSRLRFLLLIIGFILFNLINLFSPESLIFGLFTSKIVAYSSGVLLAIYYLIYIIKEFGIIDQIIETRNLIWIFIFALSISYISSNFIIGKSQIASTVLTLFPIILSISFFAYIQYQIGKKTDLNNYKLYNRTMLYSSYLGIILISSIPFFIYVGKYDQLNLSLINVAFIFTIGGYIQKLLAENKKEFEVLNQVGYFSNENIEKNIANYNLSKRELEIAELILKGLTYSEIAKQIYLALGTVSKHASNIFKKTDTTNLENFREKFLSDT